MKHNGTDAGNACRHNKMARKWFVGAEKWLELIDQSFDGFVVRNKSDMRAAMGYLWAVSQQQDDVPMTFDPVEIAFIQKKDRGTVYDAEACALLSLRAACGQMLGDDAELPTRLSARRRAMSISRALTIANGDTVMVSRIRARAGLSIAHAFPYRAGMPDRVTICGTDSEGYFDLMDTWKFNELPHCRLCARALIAAGIIDGNIEGLGDE